MPMNALTGPLPTSIGALPFLRNIEFEKNFITGSIPSSFGDLSSIDFFRVRFNRIVGSIPSTLGKLTTMTSFNIRSNKMTGTIPSVFGNLERLVLLSIFDNSLQGSIPTALGRLTECRYFLASDNRLTGAIPPELGMLTSLSELWLYRNSLTGPIPSELSNVALLKDFFVYENRLTGSIPDSFSGLLNLEKFLVQSNRLSGSPKSVFSQGQRMLEVIDISYNRFTGTLPDSLFNLPNIMTVSAVKNCFDGTVPTSICGAKTVKQLILDNLSGGGDCDEYYRTFFGIKTPIYTEGGIPSCIWYLPRLTLFRISSNGLTGSIPDDAFTPSTNLSDVSVSRNRLDGTLPPSLFSTPFNDFDVSFNRFSGTLKSSHNSTEDPDYSRTPFSLDMEANRLSGYVPYNEMKQVNSLDVLKGNIFSCDQSIPSNDDTYSTYVCGSYFLDRSLVIFAGLTGVFLLLFLIAKVPNWTQIESRPNKFLDGSDAITMPADSSKSHQSEENAVSVTTIQQASIFALSMATYRDFVGYCVACARYHQRAIPSIPSEDSESLEHPSEDNGIGNSSESIPSRPIAVRRTHAKSFNRYLRGFRFYWALLSTAIFLITILLYPVVKISNIKFSMLTYQYSYFPSAAFLSGVGPAVLVLILWLTVSSMFVWFMLSAHNNEAKFHLRRKANTESEQSPSDENDRVQSAEGGKYRFSVGSYSAREPASRTRHNSVLQMTRSKLVACFEACGDKSFWREYLFPVATWFVLICLNVAVIMIANSLFVYYRVRVSKKSILLDAFILLFNVACYNFFIPRSMNLLARTGMNLSPLHRMRIKAFLFVFLHVLAPIFATMFSDVNCFLYVVTDPEKVVSSYSIEICNNLNTNNVCDSVTTQTIEVPFVPPFVYGNLCSSAVLLNYIHIVILNYVFIGFVKPVIILALTCISAERIPSAFRGLFPGCFWPLHSNLFSACVHTENIMAAQVLHLTLLLTFGLLCPPLCLVVGVAVYMEIYVWEVILGRFMMVVEEARRIMRKNISRESEELLKVYNAELTRFDNSCKDSWRSPKNCVWLILFICSAVYASLLFDIASDQNDSEEIIWMSILVMIYPVYLLFLKKCFDSLIDRIISGNLSDSYSSILEALRYFPRPTTSHQLDSSVVAPAPAANQQFRESELCIRSTVITNPIVTKL